MNDQKIDQERENAIARGYWYEPPGWLPAHGHSHESILMRSAKASEKKHV